MAASYEPLPEYKQEQHYKTANEKLAEQIKQAIQKHKTIDHRPLIVRCVVAGLSEQVKGILQESKLSALKEPAPQEQKSPELRSLHNDAKETVAEKEQKKFIELKNVVDHAIQILTLETEQVKQTAVDWQDSKSVSDLQSLTRALASIAIPTEDPETKEILRKKLAEKAEEKRQLSLHHPDLANLVWTGIFDKYVFLREQEKKYQEVRTAFQESRRTRPLDLSPDSTEVVTNSLLLQLLCASDHLRFYDTHQSIRVLRKTRELLENPNLTKEQINAYIKLSNRLYGQPSSACKWTGRVMMCIGIAVFVGALLCTGGTAAIVLGVILAALLVYIGYKFHQASKGIPGINVSEPMRQLAKSKSGLFDEKHKTTDGKADTKMRREPLHARSTFV